MVIAELKVLLYKHQQKLILIRGHGDIDGIKKKNENCQRQLQRNYLTLSIEYMQVLFQNKQNQGIQALFYLIDAKSNYINQDFVNIFNKNNMQKVKSLQFLHEKEKPRNLKSKIYPQDFSKIQSQNKEQNIRSQNTDDYQYFSKDSLPSFLSNTKNLSPYVRSKIQKLKCWQQKQKQLITRLQTIRQQKVNHLQNLKKVHQYCIINAQKKEMCVNANQKKVNPIKININNEQKLKINKKQTDNKQKKQMKLLKKYSVISTQDQDLSPIKIKKILSDSMKSKSNYFYNMAYASATKTGNQKKQNQDAHFQFTTERNTKQLNFFGVCDGHGKKGQQISNFIAYKFSQILQQYILKDGEFGQKSLSKAYDQTLIQLYETQINIQRSGSTLNCCAIENNTLHMMNIGDSRCIMGYKNLALKWEVQKLLNDHTLKNQKEALRVEKCKGTVRKCTLNGKQVGPLRVWNQKMDKQKSYGIMMTRSIGDACLNQYGLSRRAQFMTFHFEQISARGQKIIVIGTDGLYQNLQNIQIIEFVSKFFDKGKTVEQATQQLLKLAYKKNKSINQQSDYITIIILFIS